MSDSKITKHQVKHVTKLANLPLTDEQVDDFQDDLNSVLEYISKINQTDTSITEETNQTTGLTNIFRQDELEPEKTLTQKQALSGAQNTHNGYFVVEAVLNND